MRIMAWNIERFGINKFLNNAWDTTLARQQHITSTIQAAYPDILVIIEVQTNAQTAYGGLISDTSGGPGTQALLYHLQQMWPGDNWCVVPPLIISPAGGYSEGISVFYKSNTFNFQGPWMWNGQTGEAPVIGQAVVYGGIWANALPARPSGVPGFNENVLAGRFAYWNGNNLLQFPNPASRAPWTTVFNTITTGRRITLVSVHFPPQAVNATTAFAQLTNVTEVSAVLVPNEDRVIIGDFNLNSLNPAQAAAFLPLTAGPVPAGQPQYVQTIAAAASVKSVMQSSTVGAAPFYNYGKRTQAGTLQGLDNAFVVRTGAVAAPVGTVINRVVGTAGGFNVDMAHGIPWILANLPPGGPRAGHFRTLVNYGHIGASRGASDHLPIIVDLP